MIELPTYTTGPESGPRVLLVHGLSSDAHGWWQVAEHLVSLGWQVTAVDLRGHGRAPRGSSYRIPDYASDLLAVWPAAPGTPWDAVIGHSLGGTSSLAAASAEPGWTRRLVLIDPVLAVDGPGLATVRDGILADIGTATAETVRAENPRWHDRDVEAKVAALGRVQPDAVVATTADPGPWQVADEAVGIAVPTLLIAADPEFGALLAPALAARLAEENPLVTAVAIDGAGHSIHRDDPAALLVHVDRFLGP